MVVSLLIICGPEVEIELFSRVAVLPASVYFVSYAQRGSSGKDVDNLLMTVYWGFVSSGF